MHFATNTNGIVGTFMIMWAIVMIGASVTLILYVLTIFHILKHHDVVKRWLWLSVIILFPIVGSAIYFIAVLVPYNREHPYIPKPSK